MIKKIYILSIIIILFHFGWVIVEAKELDVNVLENITLKSETSFMELLQQGAADLNDDKVIDIVDIAYISRQYGIDNEDVNWDDKFDLVSDGYIDIFDIVYVAREILNEETMAQCQKIVDTATVYLGCEYAWGGTGPNKFDSPGFTQYVYNEAIGVNISRSIYEQLQQGIEISYEKLRIGDLVFTNGGEHVGIYVGSGRYIHASAPGDVVKISEISDFYTGKRIV